MQSKLEIQDQMFSYFYNEVHDNIGQLLSTLKMQLYNIKNTSTDQAISNRASDSSDIVNAVIGNLRMMTRSIGEYYLSSLSLVAALENYTERLQNTYDVNIRLLLYGQINHLNKELELSLFNTIQELLLNAITLQNATLITLELHFKAHELSIIVSENGTIDGMHSAPRDLIHRETNINVVLTTVDIPLTEHHNET